MMNNQEKGLIYTSVFPNLQSSSIVSPLQNKTNPTQINKYYHNKGTTPSQPQQQQPPSATSLIQPQALQPQNVPSPLLSGLASYHQKNLNHNAGNLNSYNIST